MGTPEIGVTARAGAVAAPELTDARVASVNRRRGHHFGKDPQLSIHLLAGLGVEGDGHMGVTVQHLSRKRWTPEKPNLRQVHLLHAELFEELEPKGFQLRPGDLGENITTRGLDLLRLPAGTQLHLGKSAIVEVTGLRNPCVQMERFQSGLMEATLDRDAQGGLIRKAGIMGIVILGGTVLAGDVIRAMLPAEPYRVLQPV